MDKLILKIRITGSEIVKSSDKAVGMVFFDGTCEGGLFAGIILPGGVDTQHYGREIATLSARYMLEGTDFTGQQCRIFIENNAVIGEERTFPSIETDSEALAWMNTEPLTGRIYDGAEGPVIEIMRPEEEETK